MYRNTILYHGNEQWLLKLDDCRIKASMSTKQIAEAIGESDRLVYRIFAGEAKNPSVNVVRKIIRSVGGSVREIFEESGAVICGQDIVTLQSNLDSLAAELSILQAENAVLKSKADTLSAENDMLRLKLEHKEEIIALHNYYNSVMNK